jgi:hypothetical protein
LTVEQSDVECAASARFVQEGLLEDVVACVSELDIG